MTDTPVDWTDPCARAAALRSAYYSLVTGGSETEIRTRTLDAEESVKFQAANLATLRSELQDAEDECRRLQSPRAMPKRFAITCRHKRRSVFPHGSLFRGL